MATYYIDYENGLDTNAGDSFAAGHPWKTLTSGATAARIAPGDIIKVAKSPAPTILTGVTGEATWTNLSKTVTLADAQTATVELCEAAWTPVNATSSATNATRKEGSYCVKVIEDATPTNDEVQAYCDIYTHDATVHDLSGYQKISFWIMNEVPILANQLEINLCSNADGTGDVDTFAIPAISSTGRWVPLTIAKTGGGNLGNAIKSISIANGSNTTKYTASKYVYIDDFIACTTAGLNLQSLISKNSAEQGGTEGWYGIQSINGTTVLLDNDTNAGANSGRGYSGATETVPTYIRETIKTALAPTQTTAVQSIMDNGTSGNNIQYQGGYDTTSGEQTGETFFDGLNGQGYGLYISSKHYNTINFLNMIRYSTGIYVDRSDYNTFTTISNLNNNGVGIRINDSENNTFTTVSNVNNNSSYGIQFDSGFGNIFTTISNLNNNNYSGTSFGSATFPYKNTFTTVSNANNNSGSGFILGGRFNTITTLTNANSNGSSGVGFPYYSNNNTVTTITNANSNGSSGVVFSSPSSNNTVTTITNANSNGSYGVYFEGGNNNIIGTLSTTGNTTASIFNNDGVNYVLNATIAEANKVAGYSSFSNSRVFVQNLNGPYSKIFTDGGNIVSQASTLTNGSGMEWKFTTETNTNRQSDYPLKLSIAKIACVANKEVTVSGWFKKGHATNIAAELICPAQLGSAEQLMVCPSDTNENQLHIHITPTSAGVLEIFAYAWYVTGHSTVIVDALTITQAD